MIIIQCLGPEWQGPIQQCGGYQGKPGPSLGLQAGKGASPGHMVGVEGDPARGVEAGMARSYRR